MATYKPVLHKYVKEDGTSLIQIRITKFQKSVKLGTGYYIKKKDWNVKGFVRSTDSLFEKYNRSLAALIKELQDIEITANQEGNILNAPEIKSAYQGKRFSYILQLYQDYIDNCTAKDITKLNYGKSLNSFKEFLGSNTGLLVRNVSFDILQSYDKFMLAKGNSRNTANQHLAILAIIMKTAVKKGLIALHNNPFVNFKITAHKTTPVFITIDEIIKLAQTPLKDKQDMYRDIYITQFLGGGMRVRDVLLLKKANIVGDRIEYTMNKNGKSVSVPICEPLNVILNKWIDSNRNYVFPAIDPKKDLDTEARMQTIAMNGSLKIIAKKCNINPKINTHSARHAFSEIAESKTKDPRGLQHVFKHSNIETTMDYMDGKLSKDKYDYIINSVNEEFNKVGQLINNKIT